MTRKTSIEAYNKIREDGSLSRARWEVYDLLYYRGPLTASEVFMIGKRYGSFSPIAKGAVCARLSELRDVGVVEEQGSRKCSVTGHTAILWDVSGDVPVPPPEKESKTKIMERLKLRIQELEILLEQKNQVDLFQG